MEKIVLSAQDLLEDSFRLGVEMLESGFRPTLIIAIWRGGTPVGMAVQEILDYCGVESDHIAIRTSSYDGVDERGAVAVHGLNYIIKKICHDDRLLIVDDVFDTGNTIAAVIEELKRARGTIRRTTYASRFPGTSRAATRPTWCRTTTSTRLRSGWFFRTNSTH